MLHTYVNMYIFMYVRTYVSTNVRMYGMYVSCENTV